MAVKVRCPTCEKVLNAPDAARGKAIKCPGCETKIKVPVGSTPAGTSSGKAPAKKKSEDHDSSEFLARLDLDKITDTGHSMCAKCGAEIPEDATECPQCGVDPNTGQLSSSAKKKRSMKGPDPAEFYKVAWKDSWAFVKENSRVGLRTFMYAMLFSLLLAFCVGMAGNRSFTLPPRVFWGVLAGTAYLVMPGWCWFLMIETIRTTVSKKKLSLGKVNFDIFLCIALGIKAILWILVFCLIPFLGLSIVMYPLAMIHMAMPVTKRAWMNVVMLSTFFRNVAPTLYFWVIALATSVPPVIVMVVPIVLFFPTLRELTQVQDIEKFKVTTQIGIAVGVTYFVFVLMLFVSSFVVLFNARVVGLLAYYFQNSLDLTTFVAEKVYVHKEIKLDRFGVPIKTSGQKIGQVAIIVGVFVVVGAAGYFVYRQLSK